MFSHQMNAVSWEFHSFTFYSIYQTLTSLFEANQIVFLGSCLLTILHCLFNEISIILYYDRTLFIINDHKLKIGVSYWAGNISRNSKEHVMIDIFI